MEPNTFAISILTGYPPRFVVTKKGFPRATAALAHLIDLATERGETLFHESDKEFPGCIDVMMCGKESATQYAIEPEKD